MINFIKKNWLILILILLVGFIYYFPQTLFEQKMGNDYHGFHILISTDEYIKLSKIQEVYDGHYFSGNATAAEYKDGLNAEYSMVELVIGLLGKVLQLSAYQINLLMKFLMPMVLFGMLYYLMFKITRSKYGALFAPSLILLGSQLKAPQLLPQIIGDIYNNNIGGFLIYLRPSHPTFSSLFLFAGLIFLFLFFNKRKLSYGFGAGVMLGLLFYIYAFFWSYLLVAIGVVGLYFLWRRDYKMFGYSVTVATLGLTIGSMYLYGFLTAKSATYKLGSIVMRQTFFLSHKPMLDKTVLVAFIVYVAFLIYLNRKKELKRRYVFPLLLLITSLLIANQQIITGHIIQYQHWYWYTNLPSAFIAAGVILAYIAKHFKRRGNLFLIFSIIFLIYLFGFGIQYSSYKNEYSEAVYRQNYGVIFNWLNNNSVKDSVVYSDKDLSEYIPAFTHNNVYWSVPFNFTGTTPEERAIHNYLALVKIRDNPSEDKIYDYLLKHKEEISYMLLSFQIIEEECNGIRTCYNNDVLNDLADRYKEFIKIPIEDQLDKYRLDYIVWDYNKRPDIHFNWHTIYNEVYRYNNIIIYYNER